MTIRATVTRRLRHAADRLAPPEPVEHPNRGWIVTAGRSFKITDLSLHDGKLRITAVYMAVKTPETIIFGTDEPYEVIDADDFTFITATTLRAAPTMPIILSGANGDALRITLDLEAVPTEEGIQ